MFVLSQSNSYKWPVSVEFPVDGGKTEKQTFDAELKRVNQSRIDEITNAPEGSISNRDFAAEILIGWSGIFDAKGDPVPFSEGAKDTLLDVPLVSSAICKAFFESLAGVRRKN